MTEQEKFYSYKKNVKNDFLVSFILISFTGLGYFLIHTLIYEVIFDFFIGKSFKGNPDQLFDIPVDNLLVFFYCE
ncbi:MAG: hypothetical protein ACTSO7_07245 [Candidatus Heimdallarchaeota archaeon]